MSREDIVIDHVLAVSISLMEGILRIYSLRLVIHFYVYDQGEERGKVEFQLGNTKFLHPTATLVQ